MGSAGYVVTAPTRGKAYGRTPELQVERLVSDLRAGFADCSRFPLQKKGLGVWKKEDKMFRMQFLQ